MPPTDSELLERLDDDRTGDNLRALYRRYSDELYGFAYQALGDRGAADEIVQDVFTSVWRHANTYDKRRGSFRTWVYRIARNAVIDKRRRRSVRPALSVYEETPENEQGALDESIEQAALRWQVAAGLARLTPEHREVVRLAHYEGMTMREIADAKGLPIGTIKSRAWYAMRSLRLTLEEMEGTA
jgi:RNA polymerase sigma-70 factor, ECF subfamily